MTTELVYSLKLLKFTGGGGVPFHESLARKINRRQTRIRFGLDRSSGSSAAVSDRNTVFPASIRLQSCSVGSEHGVSGVDPFAEGVSESSISGDFYLPLLSLSNPDGVGNLHEGVGGRAELLRLKAVEGVSESSISGDFYLPLLSLSNPDGVGNLHEGVGGRAELLRLKAVEVSGGGIF
ncbi:unnamed protein product [Ilex paraguariensis]|uniref:Uncharacterized protein n=1 Tax=Ilex paraguariensis TaxID=185542 RepID=A0ABC8V228_9AQUA